MGGNRFQFKKFTIGQEGCAMKVGTDGVLLGAWCRVEPTDKAILDIGTGTGVIALQLAQRTECRANSGEGSEAIVEAVEIDSAACRQARLNFASSGWGTRLVLHETAVQDFALQAAQVSLHSFDHIISNPPYFIDSLPSPVASRNTARHTGALSYEELISVCDRLLKPEGRISLVLPAGAEMKQMSTIAAARGFVVSRLTEVHSTPKSGAKRVLAEFLRERRKSPQDITTTPGHLHESITPEILIIENAGPGSFSAEYRALTRDFYLDF